MGKIVEIASVGIDEYLQGLGSDPFGGSSFVGLRVPTLATPNVESRYLFLGASFSLGEGARARILGYRQLVTLGLQTVTAGAESPGRYVEMEVESPVFRLPDGNVSWHLHRLGPPNARGWPQLPPSNQTDLRSFVRRWADGPALLYQNYVIPAGDQFYTHITAYTPPNNGRPWGSPLMGGQHMTVYDLRTQWRTHGAWHALDIPVEGPDTVAMFISVQQSAGADGAGVTVPNLPHCMCEEQFLTAFPGAIYWRVGCSLIVEL